jgi:predicted transcriptional regulator
MSLLNIMVDKRLVVREAQGRAFIYQARKPRERTLGTMVGDMLGRAFAGSAHELVAHVLQQSRPSPTELQEIRRVIAAYEREEEAR